MQTQKFVNFTSIGLVATGLAFANVADSRGGDNVLNPGYITGEVTLGAEELSAVYVNASSNDGYVGYNTFLGAVYDLPVEGDKAYKLSVRGTLVSPGASTSLTVSSNAYHQVLANAEPTQVDVDRPTKRIDGTITVVGGMLKKYHVTASAVADVQGSSESYQGVQDKIAVWGLDEAAVFELPMVVDDQVTVSGYATLETDQGVEVVRELSGVNVDLVSADDLANDANWFIDLDLPSGAIAGDMTFAGALADLNAVLDGDDIVSTQHNIFISGNGVSRFRTLYGDGPYLFDNLSAGNYTVRGVTYFQGPYGSLSHPQALQGNWHAVNPPATTFVDYAPTLGAMAGQVTVGGFHGVEDFSSITVNAPGIAGTATHAATASMKVLPADAGHFVLVASTGDWAPYESILNFYNNDNPADRLSGYLQVRDYARHPSYGGDPAVVVNTNEVVDVAPFSHTTVETRVFLDVNEGGGPEVLISNGYVSGGSTTYENGNLSRFRYLAAYGPATSVARPSVRVIAEPGIYSVTVSGKVAGATVTFGKFDLEVAEPASTPVSPNDCVGLACHQEVVVSDDLTIDFSNVTAAGVTAVSKSAIGPAPSDEFTVLTEDINGTAKPIYWDVSTNAQFDPGSALNVCFSFDPSSVDADKLTALKVHQWDSQPELWDKLADGGGSNPANGVVCGTTDNLSQFVIGVPTSGGPCVSDSDCDDAFPACVDDVCWAGKQDNPCVNDNDCGDAPYCVANLCSAGEAGDACLYDNDCSVLAPYCAGGLCSPGELYDSCIYNNDCGVSAPYCAIDQCSEGLAGDLCAIDIDCSPAAPYCAIDQCSEGLVGASCAISNDCAPDAPFCGGAVCNLGIEGDACDGWDGDCAPDAPFCVNDQCHDGGLGDPCHGDSDCVGDTPYCANSTWACTTGEAGSACAYKSDCVSASCNYNTGLCN